ncbi:hypothetical protein [Jiella pelagia]|uniref:Uncharacterized protein n=1 Tax=Jiella pelagia TaxID=2986949 RepID=A0ABY7BTX2_9HYPH|nr:hypothetical protein [Jiella pelagia]WAP67199.1 hypothetical protein OH818_16615 [Jiella pelagia]
MAIMTSKELQESLDDNAARLAVNGLLKPGHYLPPRLWELLRRRLQDVYRRATGETEAVLAVGSIYEKPTGNLGRENASNAADAATAALRLHVEYERTPTDRGGKAGPKGQAWKRFVDARDAALCAAKDAGDA